MALLLKTTQRKKNKKERRQRRGGQQVDTTESPLFSAVTGFPPLFSVWIHSTCCRIRTSRAHDARITAIAPALPSLSCPLVTPGCSPGCVAPSSSSTTSSLGDPTTGQKPEVPKRVPTPPPEPWTHIHHV